jgi:hypothetical protein
MSGFILESEVVEISLSNFYLESHARQSIQ